MKEKIYIYIYGYICKRTLIFCLALKSCCKSDGLLVCLFTSNVSGRENLFCILMFRIQPNRSVRWDNGSHLFIKFPRGTNFWDINLPFVNFFPITPFFLRVKKIGTLSNEIITLPYKSPCLSLCGLKRIGKSKDN